MHGLLIEEGGKEENKKMKAREETLESRLEGLIYLLDRLEDEELIKSPYFEAQILPARNHADKDGQIYFQGFYTDIALDKWVDQTSKYWLAGLRNPKENSLPSIQWYIRAPTAGMNNEATDQIKTQLTQQIADAVIERLKEYSQKKVRYAQEAISHWKKERGERESQLKKLETLESITFESWKTGEEGKNFRKQRKKFLTYLVGSIYAGIDALLVANTEVKGNDAQVMFAHGVWFLILGALLSIPAHMTHAIFLNRSIKNRWKREKDSVSTKREKILQEFPEITAKLAEAEQSYQEEKSNAQQLNGALTRKKKALFDALYNTSRIVEDPHLNDMYNALTSDYNLKMKSLPPNMIKNIHALLHGNEDPLTRALYKTKLSFPEEAHEQIAQRA